MGIKFILTMGSALLAATLANATTTIKVACVGNSITEGYGIWDKTKYPEHLQRFLNQNIFGDEQYEVSNFGHSGRMFHKASSESYWSSDKFSAALNYGANIVIIELGTNDSKYFFDGKGSSSGYNYMYKPENKVDLAKDYEALIDTFAHQPQAPTIYATLQPYAQNVEWGIVDTAIVNVINPIIKAAAIKKGVNLIDLHALFNKTEWLLDDVVHPNETGSQELASAIHKFVQPGNGTNIIQKKNILTTPSESDECNWYKDGVLLDGESKCSLTITETGKYKVSARPYKNLDSRIVAELEVNDLDAGGNNGTPSSSSNAILPPVISSSSAAIVVDTTETETIPLTTAINQKISARGKTVTVDHYIGEISVFDLNGNLVKRVYSNGSHLFLLDRAGTYIVKTGLQTKKLHLK